MEKKKKKKREGYPRGTLVLAFLGILSTPPPPLFSPLQSLVIARLSAVRFAGGWKKKEKDAEEDEKGVKAKEGGGGEERGRGANSF